MAATLVERIEPQTGVSMWCAYPDLCVVAVVADRSCGLIFVVVNFFRRA